MPREDGQQKSHRPHARPTTSKLKRKKEKEIVLSGAYQVLYYIIYIILKVKLILKYKYVQKYSGDYRLAKKSVNPFLSTTSWQW